ncbi:MAG: hypothetical protein J5602_09740 [Clostridia bacterium]|nr:hypothetical protein [Clostridia bacterium]
MDQVHSVQELLERAAERGMPLEKMRFFINQDRHEPRCFGIYQDEYTGHWVVYKNKSDGSRAVRYSGPDEAYAAQQIWDKINSEVRLRVEKAAQATRATEAYRRAERRTTTRHKVIVLVIAALIACGIYAESKQPRRGYYVYDDDILYYQNNYWYFYDELYDSWSYYDEPEGDDWYEDAWYGSTYPFEDSGDSFYYSGYYEEPKNYASNSDNDYDYDYDYDSWDSYDTDWDSDW